MDNRLFNVNGETEELLLATLKLVFQQKSKYRSATVVGWSQNEEAGLILHEYGAEDKGVIPFPTPLTAEDCFPFVKQWLSGEFAKTVKPGEWCHDSDHDGHNEKGWQVYCGDWGHVGGHWGSICGIRPAYMWYGK